MCYPYKVFAIVRLDLQPISLTTFSYGSATAYQPNGSESNLLGGSSFLIS